MPDPKLQEDDPDLVDNGQAGDGYEPVNVPLSANVGDQRRVEDQAQQRNTRRRQQREQLGQTNAADGGAIYTRPGQMLAGNLDVQPVDGVYQEMQIMDAAPRPDPQQRGVGGEQSYDKVDTQAYLEKSIEVLFTHISALEGQVAAAKAESEGLKAQQNEQAAKAARNRRIHIINGLLTGIGFAATLATALYAIFSRPEKSKGPTGLNINAGSGKDPTKAVKIDVAGQAIAGDSGKAIDANSIMLVTHDDSDPKRLTIADIGAWVVATDGSVTFTPDAKFQGGPVSVLYTIDDLAGDRSPRARLQIGFSGKVVIGDAGGPIAQSFEQQHAITDVITIDVAAATKPGSSGAAVKPDSVELQDHDAGNPKTRFMRSKGTWTADAKGSISFQPIDGFAGGAVQQGYTIKDANGNTSDSAEIALTFYDRMKVYNILKDVAGFTAGTAIKLNLVDGSENVPPPQPAEGLTADPGSIILTGALMGEDEETGPSAEMKAKGKQLVVDDEGTWDVVGTSGDVTFTPSPKLTGDPHAITYQIADSKAVYSNVGNITLSAVADKLVAELGKINAMDDASFWTLVDTKVFKADLGSNPVGKLLLVRGVITELWMNTFAGLDPATLDQVQTQRDALTRGTLGGQFDIWRASKPGDAEGPLSPEKLFTMSKVFDDAKVGLPNVKLATRYVRLTYLHVMLGFFARYMDNMTKASGGGGGT